MFTIYDHDGDRFKTELGASAPKSARNFFYFKRLQTALIKEQNHREKPIYSIYMATKR